MTALALTLLALVGALVIDRVVGEPQWLWRRLPHPVILIGRGIAWLDARLNDPRQLLGKRRQRGVLALMLMVAAAAVTGAALAAALHAVPFGYAIEAIVVSVFLAQKSLVDHVDAVPHGLVSGGLQGGREAVARIVGRDVRRLDEAGIARAAVESAAENFSDGVVAPAFWYLLLGLPGILVYKTVNTADSMIGNRSPRHDAFGRAAARLDDVLNLVPARISAILIAATASLVRKDGRAAITCARTDARKHKSPNAGWPEAAIAGALGIVLGGPRRYGDVMVDGAWLNPAGRHNAGREDIRAAIRLIDAAWALLLCIVGTGAIIAIAIWR